MASPIILEPIMDVEVTTPQDHVGDVVGDLNRRRGMIQNQESSGSTVIVRAHVPLKEMFGYISHLRSMTKGRASFTMQFHHYDPVPRNVADEIMKKERLIASGIRLKGWARAVRTAHAFLCPAPATGIASC